VSTLDLRSRAARAAELGHAGRSRSAGAAATSNGGGYRRSNGRPPPPLAPPPPGCPAEPPGPGSGASVFRLHTYPTHERSAPAQQQPQQMPCAGSVPSMVRPLAACTPSA
jgi:hypothetical protein